MQSSTEYTTYTAQRGAQRRGLPAGLRVLVTGWSAGRVSAAAPGQSRTYYRNEVQDLE